jgi:hypothetical protein
MQLQLLQQCCHWLGVHAEGELYHLLLSVLPWCSTAVIRYTNDKCLVQQHCLQTSTALQKEVPWLIKHAQ